MFISSPTIIWTHCLASFSQAHSNLITGLIHSPISFTHVLSASLHPPSTFSHTTHSSPPITSFHFPPSVTLSYSLSRQLFFLFPSYLLLLLLCLPSLLLSSPLPYTLFITTLSCILYLNRYSPSQPSHSQYCHPTTQGHNTHTRDVRLYVIFVVRNDCRSLKGCGTLTIPGNCVCVLQLYAKPAYCLIPSEWICQARQGFPLMLARGRKWCC